MRRAGDVAAPVGAVRCAAGADVGDDVDVVVAAPFATVGEFEVVAGAAALVLALVELAAVLRVVPAGVLAVGLAGEPAVGLVVGPDAGPDVAALDVVVGADAGSMMHKARGECWVQPVLKVSTAAEVVVVVAGGEDETAWIGKMSCVSGRIAGAGLVRGFSAKFGRVDAKLAGESQIALVEI